MLAQIGARYDPPPIPIFRKALKQRGDCARSDVFGEGVVSPAFDNEKLKQLAILCTQLATRHIYGHTCGDSVAEHTAALARKLFPPMAKPLQWLGSRSGDYRVFEIETGAHVPQIRNMCGHVPRYDPIGDACATQDEARAACESHHQQTFKDQLA